VKGFAEVMWLPLLVVGHVQILNHAIDLCIANVRSIEERD
jgi:hypothetical protein